MDSTFEHISQDPMATFQEWLSLAGKSEPNDPNAAALATATSAGVPSLRMVLMKGADERGLRFFTNNDSQKGHQLQENPFAALCFHWKTMRKQVRFEGEVHALGRDEVETYFHSRSRASQIAAAVSAQSSPLPSRKDLESSVRTRTESLKDKPVPLPDFWVGYVLEPRVIEFWSDGPDRLHDRMQFTRTPEGWISQRLYP